MMSKYSACHSKRVRRRALLSLVAGALAVLAGAPSRGGEAIRELRPVQIVELPASEAPRARVPVVSSVAVRSDGAVLATAGDDHTVRLWNAADGRLIRTLRGHSDWVQHVAFSADGTLIASAGNDRRIHVWDASTGQLLRATPDHPAGIYAIEFSPDGQYLAAVGFEKVIRVYRPQTGQLVHEMTCGCADNRAIAFSPDGGRLLVGGRSGCVSIWTLVDGALERELMIHPQRIRALAFSPDASRVAVAGESAQIDVLDALGGESIMTLPGRPGKTLTLAFCGNDLLATAGSDDLVHLWDLTTGEETARGVGHTGSVASLACDSAGGRLISGSFDTTVCVWSLPDRSVRAMLERPQPMTAPR